MTKFRAGLAIGAATGYYLGARAGRGRYEQMNRALGKLRRSPTIDHAATAVGRARAVVDLSKLRVQDAVEHLEATTGATAAIAALHH
jgi:hypothetical protein